MNNTKKGIINIYSQQVLEAKENIKYWKTDKSCKKTRRKENIKYWKERRKYLIIGMIKLFFTPLEKW